MNQTVLLAVTGMSPAILTETIWALAMREKTIPFRVIAVTTAAGRERLRAVWMPDPALGGLTPWEALRSSLEAAGHRLDGRLRFGDTADDIRVITSSDRSTGRSVELEDIRTAAERCDCHLRVLSRIDLPPTFPTGMDLNARYLKGFFLLKLPSWGEHKL